MCVYPARHYPYWQDRLGDPEFTAGAFGENLTIADVDEQTTCIGDVLGIGSARFQVSQPRRPCWKLGRLHGLKTLPVWVRDTGHSGWYLRVLATGEVAPGDAVALHERPHPDWSVARANRVMLHGDGGKEEARALAAVEALAGSWADKLADRLAAS